MIYIYYAFCSVTGPMTRR